MKKPPFYLLAALLPLFFLFSGCKKSDSDNCAQFPSVKIVGSKGHYFVGDTISLTTNITPLGLYNWQQTNSLNAISDDQNVFIYPATKDDEGWYYLIVSFPDCDTHYDSTYITVTDKVVAPPCNPTNNSVSFSSIPGITFGSCSWGLDPSWNLRDLSANQPYGYPDFNIYFNPYWNAKEPEDGIYAISNTITFDDPNVYAVFISSTYQSVYFQANPGNVYVSHVGGKIQVTFCSLSFSGDFGGMSYQTNASGRLTAP